MDIDITVAAIISALVLIAEHYFPYHSVLGKQLPRIPAYVLGVLALAVSLTALYLHWGDYRALYALWAVIITGGLAVFIVYKIDAGIDDHNARIEAEEREKKIRAHADAERENRKTKAGH